MTISNAMCKSHEMIFIDKLMTLIIKNLASLRLCVGTYSVNSYCSTRSVKKC